jgi:hypothetical protein
MGTAYNEPVSTKNCKGLSHPTLHTTSFQIIANMLLAKIQQLLNSVMFYFPCAAQTRYTAAINPYHTAPMEIQTA